MDWIYRFNQALHYIEENLGGSIDYDRLGRIACCSAYHFQRMFAYMADMPLSEYIRRRRMSLAAVELLAGEKVIDVAAKYGYRSPTAFNRAFQSVHGIAPTGVRAVGAAVKSFPPISFKITVKGAEEMNFRVESHPAFQVLGISVPLDKELEKNFQTIPGVWDKVAKDGTLQRLLGLMNAQPMGVLGVSSFDSNRESGRYYVAVASTAEAEGLERFTVPAATWAIFPGSGTNASIMELERRIFLEWLPSSGYEYADAPDIEVYLSPDPENARYEVWVPVRKA